MTKRSQPELALQKSVREFLDYALPKDAVFWTATANGGKRDARTAAMLKASGVKSGVPDIILIFEGMAIFLELKSDKGRLSESQNITIPQIIKAGSHVYVCRSIEDVAHDLTECGIPLKYKLGQWTARKIAMREAA